MLRGPAEKAHPVAIMPPIEENDEKPVPAGDEERGQGGMPD